MAYYKRSNILRKEHVIGIVKVHVTERNAYVEAREVKEHVVENRVTCQSDVSLERERKEKTGR